jgi:ribosomal protein S18 acetylase RimI-like enzyme
MASDDVKIRRALVADAAVLAEIGAATFTETFGHLYPAEDLQSFLAASHSVDLWARTLADDRRAVWLAVAEETLIGFIGVGPCKLPIENREKSAGEIQQLYVLQRFHNRRLGSELMSVGLAWLEEHGQTPIYVGVWSENLGAQRFYGRYGFAKVGEYGFPVGKTVDREFILKR